MKRLTWACLCLAISGLLHFVTAPERIAHASSPVGVLFIGLGIFQLILALGASFTKHTKPWIKSICVSCFFLLCLFAVNQLFAGQASLFVKEPYSLATILRKLLEGIAGLIALSLIIPPSQPQSTSSTS